MFIVIFLITLLILVLSHEFGHFYAARRFGIKVLEFGFGLPPRVWGKKIGETIYSLNLLPIGGFVRLFGEDEVEKSVLEQKGSFASKSVGQRMVVIVAGVAMNFILAAVLFWIVLGAQGFKETLPLLTDHKFIGAEQKRESVVLVGDVAQNSPAAQAGIDAGDRITALNGKSLTEDKELVERTKENLGREMSLTLLKAGGEERQVVLTPRVTPPAGEGPLGIKLGTFSTVTLLYATPVQKVFSGLTHSYNLASYSLDILGNLISTSLQKKDLAPVSQSVAGPVGITNMAGAILKTNSPLIPYLNFMALLSLNLAIINIMPFPALDGGRLFFLMIEAVFRRKVRAEVEKWTHTVGMALLLALILLITFSDIRKLFT